MLEALGHQQQKINVKTDNSTAMAYCNGTLKEKRSKTWDMRYYWLQDKIQDNIFKIQIKQPENNT